MIIFYYFLFYKSCLTFAVPLLVEEMTLHLNNTEKNNVIESIIIGSATSTRKNYSSSTKKSAFEFGLGWYQKSLFFILFGILLELFKKKIRSK